MNSTLKKPKGFILINGISIQENKKLSISIADQLITNEDSNHDLKIVDLYTDDKDKQKYPWINKKNYHPRLSRFWNEEPTNALNFFKTLPRFNKVKVMIIHGFDLLANADTSNTIQNNLLKPLEEIKDTHVVIANCIKTNVILPTIISRATLIKNNHLIESEAREAYSICEKNGLEVDEKLNDKSLMLIAQEWRKLTNGNMQQKILASSILSGKNLIGKDDEFKHKWLEEIGVDPKVLKSLNERIFYAIIEFLIKTNDNSDLILELSKWKQLKSSSNINSSLNLMAILTAELKNQKPCSS
ncbi:hypothetical protein CL643_02900 [bacterium]|nr:hypothetical protein [bacterium]